MSPARPGSFCVGWDMGLEPTYPAWKAGVLPLNYTRTAKAFQLEDDTTV